jgi:hypothetical protein
MDIGVLRISLIFASIFLNVALKVFKSTDSPKKMLCAKTSKSFELCKQLSQKSSMVISFFIKTKITSFKFQRFKYSIPTGGIHI